MVRCHALLLFTYPNLFAVTAQGPTTGSLSLSSETWKSVDSLAALKEALASAQQEALADNTTLPEIRIKPGSTILFSDDDSIVLPTRVRLTVESLSLDTNSAPNPAAPAADSMATLGCYKGPGSSSDAADSIIANGSSDPLFWIPLSAAMDVQFTGIKFQGCSRTLLRTTPDRLSPSTGDNTTRPRLSFATCVFERNTGPLPSNVTTNQVRKHQPYVHAA